MSIGIFLFYSARFEEIEEEFTPVDWHQLWQESQTVPVVFIHGLIWSGSGSRVLVCSGLSFESDNAIYQVSVFQCKAFDIG